MSFPQRGAFARDKRTGAVVRVAEEGMDSKTWMIRPVYKSDGYWAASADLEPARDPHALRPRDLWKVAVVVGWAAVAVWNATHTLRGAGIGVWDTITYSGCLAYTVLAAASYVTGLRRP